MVFVCLPLFKVFLYYTHRIASIGGICTILWNRSDTTKNVDTVIWFLILGVLRKGTWGFYRAAVAIWLWRRTGTPCYCDIAGKIIPVFYPNLSYVEDGCKIIPLGDSYAVISGDGHGEDSSGSCRIVFECKCPLPGTTRRTDLHYTLLHYYTTQVLAEMNSQRCSECAYICFTHDATSMITGSNDEALWKELWDLTVATYGELTPKHPSKRNPGTAELVAKLKEFASESSFMCEFPSIFGTPCNCDDANINPTLPPWGKHGVFEAADAFAGSLTLDETLVDW